MRRASLRATLAGWFGFAVAVSLAVFACGVIAVIWIDEEAERAHPEMEVDDQADDLQRVLWAMLAAAPLAVGGAVALGWVIAGRALAPLRDAGERARAAQASALDLRLPTTGHDDEWDQLAHTMNELLATARASMDRIRGFTADAAHELRTPLTTIMGEADVTLRRARSPEELKAAISLMRDEAGRLAEIVSSLLLLARADARGLREQRGEIDLLGLVEAVAERARGELAEVGRTLSVRGDPVRVAVEAPLVERMIENLVRNAVVHGAGAIDVTVSAAADTAQIRVCDEGGGVPEALAPAVFGRFFRGDPARVGSGSGLGLSIASEIARAHGGAVSLESARKPTCFLVSLPRAATPRTPLTQEQGP